jgi:nucleoside-diphosphate-sugar epimerase
MKVLLLGATGNVGSRLIPALLAHKHQVVAYVRSASKLPNTVTSQLSAVIEGSGVDSAGIKAAILKENCDAVINAAGLAAMTSWHRPSQLPEIFAAVVKAAVEAGKERGGPPLRCWFMSGFTILDSPKKPYLLLD